MSATGHWACLHLKKGAAYRCRIALRRLRWTGSSAGKILGDIASLPASSTNAAERARIMKLLAEEETKFKLELSRRRDAPEGRSPVNAATDNQVEYDGEEQRV